MSRLPAEDSHRLLKGLKGGWRIMGEKLVKPYRFRAFRDGIRFVGKVAELAEEEDHHPDIHISWLTVTLTLTSHDEGGLTEKDFKMARLIDGIPLQNS